MLAPFAPHIAEELWSRLGHTDTLTYEPFPVADPALAVSDDGRGPGAGQRQGAGADHRGGRRRCRRARTRPRADERIAALLDGATVRKVIVVPGRLVNFVLAWPSGAEASLTHTLCGSADAIRGVRAWLVTHGAG